MRLSNDIFPHYYITKSRAFYCYPAYNSIGSNSGAFYYSNLIIIDGIIVSIDFPKALDALTVSFQSKSLNYFCYI